MRAEGVDVRTTRHIELFGDPNHVLRAPLRDGQAHFVLPAAGSYHVAVDFDVRCEPDTLEIDAQTGSATLVLRPETAPAAAPRRPR